MSIIPTPGSTGAIGRFLNGSAGSAYRHMQTVSSVGTHADELLGSIERGSNVPGLVRILEHDAGLLRGAINEARPGLIAAFGAEQRGVSAQLQATSANLRAQLGALGRATDWSSANRPIHRGGEYARQLTAEAATAMTALEATARRSAITKLTIGTGIGGLAIGGGIAGVRGLDGGGDEQIIAPGAPGSANQRGSYA